MIEVYAHRGLHQRERENTLAAFRAAVALGVDGVELDVRRTLDGALVIHHDPVVDGAVIALSEASQLPAWLPTLDEALDALSGVRVNVEIKNIRDASEPTYDDSGAFVAAVMDELERSGWLERVIISSFDEATCQRARGASRDVAVGWLLWDVDPTEAVTRAARARLDAVNPHFSVVDADLVAFARDHGIAVNVWTVNQRDDIETMARCGVSSIISDDPGLVASVLGELGLRTGR